MNKRLDKQAFQAFVETYVSLHPNEHLGRKFLFVHFPGHEDVDVSEEEDLHRMLTTIEERYVIIHEHQQGRVLGEVNFNG